MTLNNFLYYFLPLYFLFFGVTFFWHSLMVWKKTGVNPYVLHKAEGVQGMVARLFRPLGGLLVVIVGSFLYQPDLYLFFCPITILESSAAIKLIGLALLMLALVWVFLAQSQMGNSWRVGIDDENHAGLVCHGLFKYSRNPVFLGVRLFLLGIFLVIPSLTILFVVLFVEFLVQLQVRFEEEYLLGLHGDRYETYCRRVRRWL
jgi:protein-S-isoprenylcysteine O-methyltransferase Ste14